MKRFVLMVAVVCAGCAPERLDAEMSGEWWGTSETALQGRGNRADYPTIMVSVAARAATVRGLCLDGTGEIVATGVGARAEWAGTLECQLADPECTTLALSYQRITLAYDQGVLDIEADGMATLCSTTAPFTLSFFGVNL